MTDIQVHVRGQNCKGLSQWFVDQGWTSGVEYKQVDLIFDVDDIVLIYGFNNRERAILFKLTWGGK